MHCGYFFSQHIPPRNNSILQKSIACVTTTFISMCSFLEHALRSKESQPYLIRHKVSLIGAHALVRIFVDIKNATFHSFIIIQTRLLLTRLGELGLRDGQLAARGPHAARILTQCGPHPHSVRPTHNINNIIDRVTENSVKKDDKNS